MNDTTPMQDKNAPWKDKWKQRCQEMATEASRGDGCSYTWFVVRLSRAVDHELSTIPTDCHAQAIEIAREFGYATQKERDDEQEELAESGCCMHGIELGYCPAGCGSGPDD